MVSIEKYAVADRCLKSGSESGVRYPSPIADFSPLFAVNWPNGSEIAPSCAAGTGLRRIDGRGTRCQGVTG